MASKHDLVDWIVEALRARSGRASLIDVCRHVWEKHERELGESGGLFYTWQYDIRWAANRLRRDGIRRAAEDSPRGVWELTQAGKSRQKSRV